MTTQEISYTVTDRVATITLNRPGKLNAWTRTMEREVRAAMEEAAGDNGVRAIVVTGAGRGFCAGADMSLLQEVADRGTHPLPDAGNGAAEAFERQYSYFPSVPKPVIAAVNGPCVGLGFVIAMFCDIRLASAEARFGTAFARRGLVAEYGLAWLLPRIAGHANALDIRFSARLFGADEALRMGLVNRVFPAPEFADAVAAYARDLASTVSPRSMAVIKRQVYAGMTQTLGEALDLATAEMRASLQCEDFREGVAHFIEKRPPAFTGR